MLGDRLDTDIRAANGLGMPSILVLTGVSTRAELARTTDRPDLVVADLAELMERWTSAEPASRA
jgi:ribonucleotide monophosphatase NagD (HAD superfamily)